MMRFLVTPDNPDGWQLEDILTEIQNDIVRRSNKIVGDGRPEARAVLRNNIEILGWLTQCIDKALDSTRVLNSIGPSRSAEGGPPRIGTA
ncbi:MAG: histidine kinase [Alphaproteobacteria bacterium]